MKLLIVLAVVAFLSVLAITGRLSDGNPITRTLLYFDIFLCSLLLGNPDMTISARCGLALRAGTPWPLCWLGRALNALARGHCETAIADDLARARAATTSLLGD